MLDKEIEQALNQQINHEMAAAYNYLAMAGYFESRNLTGFAHWMFLQRDEELMHAQRLWRYLLDRGGALELPAVPKPRSEFNSIREVFEASLEQEQNNTKAINDLYTLASKKQDYATQSALQWFLDEQVEEENTVEEVLGMIDLAGDDASALLVLNRQLGERSPDGGDKSA